MKFDTAMRLVRRLANDRLQTPEISRALFIVLSAAQREAYRDAKLFKEEFEAAELELKAKSNQQNGGWDLEEDEQFIAEYLSGEGGGSIARNHKRSLTDLTDHLVRLGIARDAEDAFHLLNSPRRRVHTGANKPARNSRATRKRKNGTNYRDMRDLTRQRPYKAHLIIPKEDIQMKGTEGKAIEAGGQVCPTQNNSTSAIIWTADEDSLLVKEFTLGVYIFDIARRHSRKVGAIASRMVELQLVTEKIEVFQRLIKPTPSHLATSLPVRFSR